MDKSNDAVCSSPNNQSSPEANCPICMEKYDNKSFADSCLHQFCFTCLLEWSKVKAECPLCKLSFKSIIHNVRSIEDYEQYYLSATPVEEGMQRIFHTAHYEPSSPIQLFRHRATPLSSLSECEAYLIEELSNDVVIPTMPSRIRRNVYEQGLWVQRTRQATGRVRDCSPEFYRSNPALLQDLVPWLDRELNVLLNANADLVEYVVSRILELITQTPIISLHFAAAVSTFIGRHTAHFVHEFYCFASSSYDLADYDRYAHYLGPGDLAHDVSDDNGNNSDVQVVSSLAPTSPTGCIHLDDSDSQDYVVVDSIPPRQVSPEAISLVSDPDDDVVQVNIHVETENNRPAPSCRIPLKKRCLEVKNVHMEKSGTDNVNVSINIAHSSRTRSSSSESSLSSYNPFTSKSSSTKSKGKLNGSKKTSKSKSSLSKNKSSKSKGKITSKGNKGKLLSSVRKRRPQRIKSSSENKSDSDNKLQIITDDKASSSSSDESYKPKLRSVVVKSTVKSELYSMKTNPPTISGSYWNEGSCKHEYKSETDGHSRSNPPDPYGPSCSYHSSDNSRSLSPEYKQAQNQNTRKRA